ncbi:hypothetical protein [Massilia sp. BSC265]|uniref:hypothetical protein n=1 Tax=Massilia sp. BSC265 TaxID=1549812 RepID=UPI0004E96E7E|nr:hypothetical protein [Massilia sp. BSC265]KFI08350.1 hypothetical protein JN27_04070 [Massilia sp. BSC265]
MSNNHIHRAATLVASGAGESEAAAASSAMPTRFRELLQDADPTAVRQLFGTAAARAGRPEPELSGTGFTYRHDWGARRGQWVLRLNWNVIQPASRVFAAIGEGVPGGTAAGKMIGSARYTLHNVAPRRNGVDIWVNIAWSADISLYVDYLIINP